jgi:cytochrome c peroxidase
MASQQTHRPASRRRTALASAMLAAGLGLLAAGAHAEEPAARTPIAHGPDSTPAWAAKAAVQARLAPRLRDVGKPPAPSFIPATQITPNANGDSATYRPAGSVATTGNAFFTALGSNGRTCSTCHKPEAGWGVTPTMAQAEFQRTQGLSPLFQPVDGTFCSTDDVSTLVGRSIATRLVLSRGLFRIFETLPAAPTLQYRIIAVKDPHKCNTNPATGLTSFGPNATTAGVISVYRRPLPTANLAFLSTIMWDGRESTLAQQAIDAVAIHEQASTAPTNAQVTQMLAFETSIYAAQVLDFAAGNLTAAPVSGGPVALASQPFFIGINDPNGHNPNNTPFNDAAFSLYAAWAPGQSGIGTGAAAAARNSIARGEAIFNTRSFSFNGQTVTCSTCHDSPNAGSNSDDNFFATGVAIPGAPHIDQSDLPIFTLQCNAGPLAGQTFVTTDPGRAIVTGQCADINKFKPPTLRNLAARTPLFHNGGAREPRYVVGFYNDKFSIGLSDQEIDDLTNFLHAL